MGNTDERRGNYNWILSYDQLPQNCYIAVLNAYIKISRISNHTIITTFYTAIVYTILFLIENGKIVVIKNGKIVVADTFYAVNPYQDFGIIESNAFTYFIAFSPVAVFSISFHL